LAPWEEYQQYQTDRLHAASDTPIFHGRKKSATHFFWRGNRRADMTSKQ
jgi:hypothetical protein